MTTPKKTTKTNRRRGKRTKRVIKKEYVSKPKFEKKLYERECLACERTFYPKSPFIRLCGCNKNVYG